MKTNDKKMFSNLVIADIKSSLSGHLLALSKRYLRVADVMSTNVATTRPEETVASAAGVMSERNISCIIVMDDADLELDLQLGRRFLSNKLTGRIGLFETRVGAGIDYAFNDRLSLSLEVPP